MFEHISQIQWMWLAGLLEAEGSFMAGPPSAPNCPVVKVEMTDEDVIAYFSKLVGRKYHTPTRRQPHHKQSYVCMVRGKNAIFMMKTFLPVMGVRRQKDIRKAIKSYDPTGGVRLSEETKCRIREDRIKGYIYRELQKKYNRGFESIYKVVHGVHPTDVHNDLPLPEQFTLPKWHKTSSQEQLYWLAGWIEGEGCFATYENVKQIIVSASCSDYDIVYRAQSLVKGALDLYPNPPAKDHWSVVYSFIARQTHAAAIMMSLYPLMFSRRQQAIETALHSFVKQKHWETKTANSSKLKFKQAEEIRKKYQSGWKNMELARYYKVSPAAITYIIQRRNHAGKNTPLSRQRREPERDKTLKAIFESKILDH
jgi:Mor family transcriptional regulator